MRILSQDGMADLPYESIGICIHYYNKTDIIAYPAGAYSPDDEYWTLAKYSTEDKARKAMEMLRNFNEVREVRNIPIKEAVVKTLFEPLKKLFEICAYEEDEILKMDLVKASDYFQFPSDDKVEVWQ